MASAADNRTAAALLFAFSAALLLLLLLLLLLAHAAHPQPPRGALAGLLLPALHRFVDGRGVLLAQLATRANMLLLCHAILLLILRDAGVLGAPAARRRAEPAACSVLLVPPAPSPSRPRTRAHAGRSAAHVWRPPRRTAAAPPHGAARRVHLHYHVEHQVQMTALTREEQPVHVDTKHMIAPEEEPADTEQAMVALLEEEKPACRCREREDYYLLEDDGRDRAAAIVLVHEQPTAGADTAREEQPAEMELADDRTFEEFIRSQRRKMRQESLRLARSSSACQQEQAIATC